MTITLKICPTSRDTGNEWSTTSGHAYLRDRHLTCLMGYSGSLTQRIFCHYFYVISSLTALYAAYGNQSKNDKTCKIRVFLCMCVCMSLWFRGRQLNCSVFKHFRCGLTVRFKDTKARAPESTALFCCQQTFVFSCPRTPLVGNALPSFGLSCLELNSVMCVNYFSHMPAVL